MEIKSLTLLVSDLDLNSLAVKYLPPKTPVRKLRFATTPRGLAVSGEFLLLLPVPFEALWELAVREGRLLARLADLRALNMPVRAIRPLLLQMLGEAAGKKPWLACVGDVLHIDVETLVAEEGVAVRCNLQEVVCRDGHLHLLAGVP